MATSKAWCLAFVPLLLLPLSLFPLNVTGILQICGGLLMLPGYVMQIRRICITKMVDDISLIYTSSIFTGICLMETYGIRLLIDSNEWVFLATNSVSLVLSGSFLFVTLFYKLRNHEPVSML